MSDASRHIPRQSARGREAATPQHIPAPGWKDVFWRSWREISDNNIFLVSGGVSYAVMLALFPGLAALVSLYGLIMDPAQIQSQVNAMSAVVPEQTRQMLQQELQHLTSASHGTLSAGAAIGIVLALWSASRGMSGMISALNIAYEEKEHRGFFVFNSVALALTLGFVIGGILALVLVAGLPSAVQFMGLAGGAKWLLLLVQWPVLAVLLMLGLAVLYRYGPSREAAQWRWVSPGAVAATVIWIVASVGFTVYVANFSSYDKTYGSLGGAVVLLTWLYISAFVVLLGAAINAQTEQQTRQDTTTGEPREIGDRGARAADRVGPSAERR